MNIVFVAGGLGTRFNELSVFPKILLPTATHNSILEESISKFSPNNNFYIIINSKYADMVDNYIEVNHLMEWYNLSSLTILKTSVANGSLSTLADVESELPTSDVLFVWSDIILPDKKDFDIQKECQKANYVYQSHLGYQGIVFTSTDKKYRYNFDGEYIQEVSNYDGNIPGVYYFLTRPTFANAPEKVKNLKNADLVDLIRYYILTGNYVWDKIDIPTIIEYKDLETYKKLLKDHEVNLSQTRFFNHITIDKEKGIVSKEAIDYNYFKIIYDEADWYKNVKEAFGTDVKLPIPEIYNASKDPAKIEMEYLKDYTPLHNFVDTATSEDIIKAYNGIKSALEVFETKKKDVEIDDFVQDLEKELYTKVIDRCEKISHMLINYNKEELSKILDKVMHTVLDQYKNKSVVQYNICHGDLNGSNVMVNVNDPSKIKFIDPRGYFGFTKLYGWDVYEYSKLLYGLMGYDDFNLNPQIYLSDEPHINKHVNEIEYLKNPLYKLIVGIIYVALAGYISQDIMKANIAYEYGLKLINEYYGA